MDININPTKLVELSKYQMQLKTNENEVVILLQYPPNWRIVAPSNENINCGQRGALTYYHSVITDTVFDEIFKAIDKTIDFNREMEEKLVLLKQKTDEMVGLFEKEDLETLKTLKFSFKRSRNKKSNAKTEDAPQDVKLISSSVLVGDGEIPQKPVESTPVGEESPDVMPIDENRPVGVEGITYAPHTEDEITYDDLLKEE